MSLGSFASFIMSMVFISFKCITLENTCKGKQTLVQIITLSEWNFLKKVSYKLMFCIYVLLNFMRIQRLVAYKIILESEVQSCEKMCLSICSV